MASPQEGDTIVTAGTIGKEPCFFLDDGRPGRPIAMGVSSPGVTIVQDIGPMQPIREALGQLEGRKGHAGRKDDVYIVRGQSRAGPLGRSDPTNPIVNA